MTNPDELAPEMLRHVRAWLRARGLKQVDAARHLGVSEPTFSNWLRGTQNMNSAYFQQLASMLGISPAELLHSPASAEQARRYDRALAVIKAMNEEQLEAWLRMGEAVVRPDPRKV